jgi:hypothetical protein
MLLRVNARSHVADRVSGKDLKSFGLDERGFQKILFRSLGRLLPDEELLLISQSRDWQEEPDLLALDERGRLFIFEIKAWESRSENLLQALRYGQIFGTYDYASLDELFHKFDETGRSLKAAHHATFGVSIDEGDFNRDQAFVILTNGLDFKTRQAIQYWRQAKLNVRPWVYRVYPDAENREGFLLEMARFSAEDNPYEDAKAGFFLLNTNFANNHADHEDMLTNRKAAAYYSPWKQKIEQLSKGDTVFLYQSGVGVVAVGRASGNLRKAPHDGHADEEYFMALEHFQLVDPPIPAAKIKEITEANYVFRGTMFSMDEESGNRLFRFLQERR